MSEPSRFRDLCELPPLYVPYETWSTVELLSEPQGLAGYPLHEFIIHSVPADQNQDLNQRMRDLW